MKLAFTIYGKAQPGGSKKPFAIRKDGIPTGQIAVVDANKHAKSWQQEVRHSANEARVEAGCIPWIDVLDGPVGLKVRFYRQRPAGHYGSGKNAGVVKESAPAYPTTKPDATKNLRSLEDALTGVLWRDDSQVVFQEVRKVWGFPERTEVEVWAIEEAT